MNKTCIIRTIDNLVTVSIAGKGQFTVPNCSDELFDKIVACRYDYDKLSSLLNPKRAEIEKKIQDYKELEESIFQSQYLEKQGDSLYIRSISDISVPQELAIAIIKAENDEDDELLQSYLNFWKLASMNPNANARANMFWFCKKYGIKISKSGFLVTYRNVELKDNSREYNLEEAKAISDAFIKVKLNWKKSPKDYTLAWDTKDSKYVILRIDDEKLYETYTVCYEHEDDYDYDEYDEEDEHYYESEPIKRYNDLGGDLDYLYKELSREKDKTTFTDSYSRTFTIKLGQVVSMSRDKCDENNDVSCSKGLHCAGWSWIQQNYFGKIPLMCLVNPAQVVSVPRSDDYGKIRCCEYYPVAIVEYKDGVIQQPELDNGFDDSFLDIVLADYGINNEDVEIQYIEAPTPYISKEQMVKNLQSIKDKLKSRIIE